MSTAEKHFNDPVDLLNFLSSWNNSLSGFVFRGHSREEYQLIPSVLREENRKLIDNTIDRDFLTDEESPSNLEHYQIQFEYTVLREFYKQSDIHGLKVPNADFVRKNLAGRHDYNFIFNSSDKENWIPSYLHDTAALAQHYGLPTRLLDWSYDPFVAAHFALKQAINETGNIAIWCLNASSISHKLNLKAADGPLKFITPPYFDNVNLAAQKGLFTHIETSKPFSSSFKESTTVNRQPLDLMLEDLNIEPFNKSELLLYKLTLPNIYARKGYNLLEAHGYGEARIYPGYKGIVKQIMRQRLTKNS